MARTERLHAKIHRTNVCGDFRFGHVESGYLRKSRLLHNEIQIALPAQ